MIVKMISFSGLVVAFYSCSVITFAVDALLNALATVNARDQPFTNGIFITSSICDVPKMCAA